MNKTDLIAAVQKNLGKETTRAAAERAVEAVITGIKGGLKKDKTVQLIGFGTFKVTLRKARIGTNPKTKEKIKIKASKGVRFSAGKDLKKNVS
jgi:DNA-binding protein HU-beta